MKQPRLPRRDEKWGGLSDYDYFPFLGIHYGRQLYKISTKYWKFFLKNYGNPREQTYAERKSKRGKTVLWRVRTYAIAAIRRETEERRTRLFHGKVREHTKIYFHFFRITPGEFVPCELMGVSCNDIHHIDCKGMGGSKDMDFIENLMAAARDIHTLLGDNKRWNSILQEIHFEFMEDETPYILKNPHHEIFDEVMNKLPKYKDLIEQKRREIW